jgi:hypothetical protein
MQARDVLHLLFIRKTYMFEYVAPKRSVQQRTGKWHIYSGCWEKTTLYDIWLVDLQGEFAESQFYPNFFCKTFLSKFYLWRVEVTPKYYIVASYIALAAIQQSLECQKPPPLGVYGPELLFKSF